MNNVKRVVNTKFWTDDKVVNVFSPEDKYFFLYLLTNGHTSQLGIYHLVPKQAAFELGYSIEAVSVLLDRFENKYGIIKYSKSTYEVAIKNSLFHSIVKGGKPVMDCLLKEEREVENRELLWFVLDGLEKKYSIHAGMMNSTVLEYMDHLREERTKEENYQKHINNNDNDNERIVACDFLRLKDLVIAESIARPDSGECECEWCGNKVERLEEHHFPFPKRLGGSETVRICPECHRKFHRLEYENRVGVYANSRARSEFDQKIADEMFEKLWKKYPRKLGKGSIRPATKRRLYSIGYDELSRCIERFKKDMEGKDDQYVMYGSTFFNSGYVDYLDENYADGTESSDEEELLPFR